MFYFRDKALLFKLKMTFSAPRYTLSASCSGVGLGDAADGVEQVAMRLRKAAGSHGTKYTVPQGMATHVCMDELSLAQQGCMGKSSQERRVGQCKEKWWMQKMVTNFSPYISP